MVSEARGRFYRRKDNKYLIYLPKKLAEDSMFPFKTNSGRKVKISFDIDTKKIFVEKFDGC